MQQQTRWQNDFREFVSRLSGLSLNAKHLHSLTFRPSVLLAFWSLESKLALTWVIFLLDLLVSFVPLEAILCVALQDPKSLCG